ncbi:NHL repeat-containing protein [Emticicia fontis]
MTSLRTILLLLYFCILSFTTFAQNVTILPGGITPNQGSTYPRLSYDEIASLTSPQDGDIAYDVTFKCMRLYNGSKWVRLVSDDDLNIPSMTGWSAGGGGPDEGKSVTTDPHGNVYVTGYFTGTASFGTTIVTSDGGQDIYIAKYQSNGTLEWVRTAGGSSDEIGMKMAVNKNGDIFLTGAFVGSSNFSGTIINSVSNTTDVFVAKYDKDGLFQWVQQGGGNSADVCTGLVIDSTDNVYISGYFKSTATFGPVSITSAGEEDAFIAKYNANGILQWIQRTGGANTDFGRNIAVDKNGYVYVTGFFVGASTIGNNYFPGSGGADIFIAKYNPFTSSWVWSGNGISSGDDSGVDIITDADGNFYLTGYFGNTLNLGGGILNNSGNLDMFVAKFSTNLGLIWLKKAGGSGQDIGMGIELDKSGNVYIAGVFQETTSFENTSLTSNGDYDVFIAKYNNVGVMQWVQKIGATLADQTNDISVDSNDNAYVTGYFQNTVKFGNANLTSAGIGDIFVARIKE